jgi:undecaprenyl diphosphate synthase
MGNSLEHIAFILDGNRRWASIRGIPLFLGHKSGYDVAKSFATVFPKYGIKYVTYYLFSTENWKRSKEEVDYLMGLFYEMLCDSDDFLMQNGIRIILIGDSEKLSKNILEKARHVEEITKNNDTITVAFAISYGGRDEIVRAIRKLIGDVEAKKIGINGLDEDTFSSYLDTNGLPYPDAVVRTSEKRLSNFLIWQSAYSEVFFVDKLWPDFNEDDLKSIVAEFLQRKRRYGE